MTALTSWTTFVTTLSAENSIFTLKMAKYWNPCIRTEMRQISVFGNLQGHDQLFGIRFVQQSCSADNGGHFGVWKVTFWANLEGAGATMSQRHLLKSTTLSCYIKCLFGHVGGWKSVERQSFRSSLWWLKWIIIIMSQQKKIIVVKTAKTPKIAFLPTKWHIANGP
jgi:hypothetical protein